MPKIFNDIYKDKRILITGHTGFKGSWLSIWLHRLNAEVIGYALGPPTNPSLFDISGIGNKIISIRGDVRDRKVLRDVFERYQPEIVFHMAAQSLVRCSYKEPVKTYETNIMGTVNVLEVCRHSPSVKTIVNITSDKCYENRELARGYTENDAMGGFDPYSSSKGCAELITSAYTRSYFNPDSYGKHGKLLTSVRAGNIIGGGDWAEDRLIPDCIRAFEAKKPVTIRYPNAVRPWQHVLEPLSGYLLLAQQLYIGKTTYVGAWNFGPDDKDARSVKWLVEYITKKLEGSSSWIVDKGENPYEGIYLTLDCSKSRSRLGWHPSWNLEIALDKTIEWYKAYFNHEDMLNVTIEQIENYEGYLG
jgi:CDP-glucose 4,6-dehydratase